ncbi:hypothetical protein AB6A40_010574 [Gnathostoma spinigerum]|uniref:UAS domain-containing protein n=1 Tax=Gnathostoma spinigerum TaxID=75299 RepID=A0ABD6F3H9_9BILA
MQFSEGHLFISPVLSVANPHADVHKFIEDFESRYCDGRKIIDWMDMSYEEALRECKASLRFMIVYLHSPSHQSTEHFIRSTLLSVHFQTLITENNIAMWGASVRSQEGYKVSMALRENTYPFMGLLCVRDHRMALILRLEGEYVLSSLLTTIQGAIEENKVFLDAVRSER